MIYGTIEPMSQEKRYLPDTNRIGVLTAAVLLAYALARLIDSPGYALDLNLAGVTITIPLNLTIALIFLAVGLTASGIDWLLRNHPSFHQVNTLEHWVLPALTTLVIGFPLYTLPNGLEWWLSFALGGVLLVAVFLAEYITVDSLDARYSIASAVLVAVSFALFLILASALRYAGARLYFLFPLLWLAAFLVSLRVLHLRLMGSWEWAWAAGIALACAQLAAAFHYLPLGAVQYGLLLLGPLYALTSMANNILEGAELRRAGIVTAGITLGFWILSALL
jgi:hypothetical protein